LSHSVNTTINLSLSPFVGDSGSGGTIGAVPAPAPGDGALYKYLSADGVWRNPATSGAIDHNSVSGLQGGIASGVFEESAFEDSAFQTGIVQYYHITYNDFVYLDARKQVHTTAINTTLLDSYRTLLVTASGVSVQLPKADNNRIGMDWTIIQDCTGTVTITPDPTDTILLSSGTTVTLSALASSVTLRCISSDRWAVV
jgi:hypothetical protein